MPTYFDICGSHFRRHAVHSLVLSLNWLDVNNCRQASGKFCDPRAAAKLMTAAGDDTTLKGLSDSMYDNQLT